MPASDPLDNLEFKACPNCLEPMQPAGSMRELSIKDRAVVAGSAYWTCPRCETTATA